MAVDDQNVWAAADLGVAADFRPTTARKLAVAGCAAGATAALTGLAMNQLEFYLPTPVYMVVSLVPISLYFVGLAMSVTAIRVRRDDEAPATRVFALTGVLLNGFFLLCFAMLAYGSFVRSRVAAAEPPVAPAAPVMQAPPAEPLFMPHREEESLGSEMLDVEGTAEPLPYNTELRESLSSATAADFEID